MTLTKGIQKGLRLFVAAMMLSALGCGQGFVAEDSLVDSASRLGDASQQAGDAFGKDMNLGITTEDAEKVNESLKNALGVIQGLDQLSPVGAAAGQAQGVKGAIDRVFGLLFDNLVLIKGKIADARTKIEGGMAVLNPALPMHAQALTQMQMLLDQLDQFEAKIDLAVEKIISQIEKVFDRIDDVIARLDPTKIPHLVGIIALESLKLKIQEALDELVAVYGAA